MPTMAIIIDGHRTVFVDYEKLKNEDGEERIVLGIPAVSVLLDAWLDLDPARRFYSWPVEGDGEAMIVAWLSDESGLVHEWVRGFFDGVITHDAHDLAHIDEALPSACLKWGEHIGEPAP